MRVVHTGWSSERSVSAAAEPPRGPPRPHGSARPPGRLAHAALWCAEPRVSAGSSATQDHHTRVPRAVSGCRCAPRELNEHAEPIGALPRPTTARRIASPSTPPRSAAAAEAIAADARTARARAARATGADRLPNRGCASRRSKPSRVRAASVDPGLRLHRSGHGTPQRAKVAARAAGAGRALLAACRCYLICQAGGAVAAFAASAPRSECVWRVQ